MKSAHTHRTGSKRVCEEVDALIGVLNHRARRLDRESACTTALYWRIWGSQKMLREVARHLQGMRNLYDSDYCLYKALVEYLECLAVVQVDANEEATHLSSKNRRCIHIQAWIAQGEAYVLPRICTELARLVQHYAPPKEDGYVLSPDGTHLVCFPPNDEPILFPVYRKERYSVC